MNKTALMTNTLNISQQLAWLILTGGHFSWCWTSSAVNGTPITAEDAQN